MIAAIKGLEVDSRDLDLRNTGHLENMSYEEWKSQKSLSFSADENELFDLITKYGSQNNLMVLGTDREIERYSNLLRQTGLTQSEIEDKMFEDPNRWENLLSSQTKKETDRLGEQLLDIATDEELSALHMWTGSTFGNINRMMRYEASVDQISAKAAEDIERVLYKVHTNKQMIAKRGTGTINVFRQVGVTWGDAADSFVGKTWTDNGFVATSPFNDGGFGGAGKNNATLFIRLPKGTHAAYIGQESHLELEKELLIQRGYSYRIVKAEYRPNQLTPEDLDLFLWVELF